MNNKFKSIFFLILLIISHHASAATITPLISYQGRLLDSASSPVSSNVIMTFRLYDEQTGGSFLWNETKNVQVINGIFNTYLGDTSTLTVPQFNSALWLEIIVGGETLTPRQQLSGSPYAFSLAPGAVISNTTHNHDSRYAKSSQSCTIGKVVTGVNAGGNLVCGDFSANVEARLSKLENIFNGTNRSGNDIYFNGTNIHITSGSGATDGGVNGLGNLVIGYNEPRGGGLDLRTGSHNLVLGSRNNYESYGGLVAGSYNHILGPFASVSGGASNTASGYLSSVSGGNSNTASGSFSSASGGFNNRATEWYSSVSGGNSNTASGDSSAVSGGSDNTATGLRSSVSGGSSIITTQINEWATINFDSFGNEVHFNNTNVHITSGSGRTDGILNGLGNLIIGYNERSYTGNIRTGSHNIVMGRENSYGSYGGLVGGDWNEIMGPYASVSGGYHNRATGLHSLVVGGYNNIATRNYSSVYGGRYNNAISDSTSIIGGEGNRARGYSSTISGGFYNDASGEYSSISGGKLNKASGTYSSVSGGYNNTAIGEDSVVSGGKDRTAPDIYNWAAGGYWQDW